MLILEDHVQKYDTVHQTSMLYQLQYPNPNFQYEPFFELQQDLFHFLSMSYKPSSSSAVRSLTSFF